MTLVEVQRQYIAKLEELIEAYKDTMKTKDNLISLLQQKINFLEALKCVHKS